MLSKASLRLTAPPAAPSPHLPPMQHPSPLPTPHRRSTANQLQSAYREYEHKAAAANPTPARRALNELYERWRDTLDACGCPGGACAPSFMRVCGLVIGLALYLTLVVVPWVGYSTSPSHLKDLLSTPIPWMPACTRCPLWFLTPHTAGTFVMCGAANTAQLVLRTFLLASVKLPWLANVLAFVAVHKGDSCRWAVSATPFSSPI